MEMTVRMPANYNYMTEEEMTYTTGGDAVSSAVNTVTGVAILGLWVAGTVHWIDMLLGARRWYAANQTGDLGTDLENAVNAWMDFTTSSVVNCVRSICGTLGSMTFPIGWIGTAVAFLTV